MRWHLRRTWPTPTLACIMNCAARCVSELMQHHDWLSMCAVPQAPAQVGAGAGLQAAPAAPRYTQNGSSGSRGLGASC